MVVIRLARVGKKNSPAFRVVVADKRRAVKRKFIEVIGYYIPIQKPKELKIDKERALFWLKRGAQPSNTVRNIMADLGIVEKNQKINIKYAKSKKKKELKAEKENKPSPKAEESAKAEPIDKREKIKDQIADLPVKKEKSDNAEKSETPSEESNKPNKSETEKINKIKPDQKGTYDKNSKDNLKNQSANKNRVSKDNK